MGVKKDCFCECVANMKRNLREHFNMGQGASFVVLLGDNGGFLAAGTITDIEKGKVILTFPGYGGYPSIISEVSICCICVIKTFDYGQAPQNAVLDQLRNRIMGLQ